MLSHPPTALGNSIYNVHKVSLQLTLPPSSGSLDLGPSEYAREILQSHAAVLDIDNDDLYLPGKTDVPEFPRTSLQIS